MERCLELGCCARERELRVLSFDLVSGKVISSKEYELVDDLQDVESEIEARAVGGYLLLKRDSHTLCIVDMSVQSDMIQCRSVPHAFEFVGGLLLEVIAAEGIAVLKKLKDGELVQLARIENYITHSAPIEIPDYDAFAVLSATDTANLEWIFDVYDCTTGEIHHHETFKALSSPQRLFLGSYTRQNASIGFRFVVVGFDAVIHMLQQGQVVWEKNEVISSIVAAMFVDPPTHGPYLQADPAKWIYAQYLSLKVQFKLNSPTEKRQLTELRLNLSGKNLPVKDPSGYRKYIIALTTYNIVVALHTGDGRILWQLPFDDSLTFDGLALWSYSHSEDASPKVLLYKKGQQGHYAVIDAHTGAITQQSSSPIAISKIIKLPQPLKQGDTDQSLFVLVDMHDPNKPIGHVIPEQDLTQIEPIIKRMTIWDTDAENAYGFAVQNVDLHQRRIQFHMSWKLIFNAKILSLSERGSNDPVHSYTKVLGDRSLLFKYVNPNTAVVVVGESGENISDDALLEMFIIDTVTGRILLRQMHDSASGPVHCVISQHWAVYHYWSIANQRFQISTVEMYDASHRQLTVSDLLTGDFEQTEQISSYDPIPIQAFNATFFVSVGVKSLAVTKTLKGITTQLLLMRTATDQIYAMNKRFLDPRRPIRPTPQSKDERLLPYSEILRLLPTQYISYNYQILGMKGMASAPAALESAAHLFVFGDDLYYTRLQPERGFDTLDDDFNYGFLILTLLAMLVGSIICQYMVHNAKLQRKWK